MVRHVKKLPFRWLVAVVLCYSLPLHAISPLDDAELNRQYYNSHLSNSLWSDASGLMPVHEFSALTRQHTTEDPEDLRALLAMDIHHSPNVDYSEATFMASESNPQSSPPAASSLMTAAAALPSSELIRKVSALIAAAMPPPDASLTRNLLSWQLQQDHGSNGKLAQAQTLFSDIMSSQLGSERYSLRWAGNLSDVLMIQPDPLQDNTFITDVIGNEVELRMSGNTAILLEVKGYRSKP